VVGSRLTPGPHLKPIAQVSPTLGDDLRACHLRVAFRRDPAFKSFNRLKPAAALGRVSHELSEAVARGALDQVADDEIESALESDFDKHIAEKEQELSAAWPLGRVPPAARWPGYQLTRVRLVQRLSEEARRRRAAQGARGHPPEVELWVEVPDGSIGGRIDRVERVDGFVELVDLKSGWTVDSEIRPAHRRQLLIYAYLWHAAHGDWPRAVSVQRLDGARSRLEVDPKEAEEAALELVAQVSAYNAALAYETEAEAFASPSKESCAYCPFRVTCRPYFDALSEEWELYSRSVLGRVRAQSVYGATTVLQVDVEKGNLADGIRSVRILGVPVELDLRIGAQTSFVDATRTPVAADVRVAWGTQLLMWG
jgi:RecB family exonuclease